MYLASVNKYYVDDFYQLVFARGGVLIANALWWFDAKIIDGAVNGTGWLARDDRLRPAEDPDRAGRELRPRHRGRPGGRDPRAVDGGALSR